MNLGVSVICLAWLSLEDLKTVVGDWCFDYLLGSQHLQSQVEMMVFMPVVMVWIGQFCHDVIYWMSKCERCSDWSVVFLLLHVHVFSICWGMAVSFEVIYESLVRCRWHWFRGSRSEQEPQTMTPNINCNCELFIFTYNIYLQYLLINNYYW